MLCFKLGALIRRRRSPITPNTVAVKMKRFQFHATRPNKVVSTRLQDSTSVLILVRNGRDVRHEYVQGGTNFAREDRRPISSSDRLLFT